MKEQIPVFILAGGKGTRLSEETQLRPKPMVEIGDIPILLHIMKLYYRQGFNDFVICAGYRSWDIKNYFLNYQFRMNHLEIDHREHAGQAPQALGENTQQERWRVRVVDTGKETLTGARVARAFDVVSQTQDFSHFALTYGDGLSDVDLQEEWDFHLAHGRVGTVLGVTNTQRRFGVLDIGRENLVTGFVEKPEEKQDIINGGFFFFRSVFRNYLSEDEGCTLEREPMEKLAQAGQLMSFRHKGFWFPMDTLRDRQYLEELWESGEAPWDPKRASGKQEVSANRLMI